MPRLLGFNRKNAQLFLAKSKDGAVLLDVGGDRLIKLNGIALEMIRLLSAGSTEPQIVSEIRERYSVDERAVATDLENLIRKLQQLELDPSAVQLEEPSLPAPVRPPFEQPLLYQAAPSLNTSRGSPTRVMVAASLLGLLVFDMMMAIIGMRALCALVKHWPVRQERSIEQAKTVSRVTTAIERACVWYPKKVLCLQRSAVMTSVLRSLGIPAQMLIGARAMPLLAHAWVEIDGTVINDFPRVRTFYLTLTRY